MLLVFLIVAAEFVCAHFASQCSWLHRHAGEDGSEEAARWRFVQVS